MFPSLRVRPAAIVVLGSLIGALCVGCRSDSTEHTDVAPDEPNVTFVRIKHVSWWLGVPWELLVWGDPNCAASWDDSASALAVSVSYGSGNLLNGDFNNDGVPDPYFVNSEMAAMVVWDGCSLAANGFDPVVTAIEDRDGDGLPELWIRRGAALATLYSARGEMRFDEHP